MTKISETVVFFGSGPVAAKSLELLAENFTIEAVITKPRAAHHKGDVPVLRVAEKLSLPIYTASDRTSLDKLFDDVYFASRLGILIDFGIIVSQKVIDYFPLGIINSHFSLLPEWRGADPITFAILSGQKTTGVSLMLLVEKMDEGPLLGQSPLDIDQGLTTPALTETLIDSSYQSLRTIVPLYLSGHVSPAPQETVTLAASDSPTYSRKLTKDDGVIDWHKPAEQLEREIRAFMDWPKSRTKLAEHEIIITKAHVEPSGEHQSVSDMPGTILVLPDKQLAVVTSKDLLVIDRLKPAGKNEMAAQAFLAGHSVN